MKKKFHGPSGDKQSFWTTLPGILTAIAAVITAVGGLLVALHTAGLIGAGSTPAPAPVANSVPNVVAQPTLSGPPADVGTTSAGCFEQYFQGIAGDRIYPVETGAQDLELIRPDQSIAEPIGIRFTDFGQTIGAIKFQYFASNQVFKLFSVVDAGCAAIQDYSNVTRGGVQNILQNFDTLQMRLGNANYQLRLEYDGSLTVVFRKLAP